MLLATTSFLALVPSAFQSPALAACQAVTATTTNASGLTVTGLCVTTSFTGHIRNNGFISTSGIAVTGGTITGFISNSTIGTFAGGIFVDQNSQITANSTAAIAVGGTFSGGITNNGSISVVGTNNGIVIVNASSFSGGIVNNGSINAQAGVQIFLSGDVSGGVTNNGTITATNSSGAGVLVASAAFSGNVVNTGTIDSAGSGISVAGVSTFTGSISNSGTISATTGISVSGVSTFTGSVENSGIITATTGIAVRAGVSFTTVGPDIINTGSITGTSGTAIDASGATMPVTIDQNGGTINGAIKLSAFADVLNIAGGTIVGNIVGQGASNTINFNLGAGSFTYASAFGFSGVHAVAVNSGTVYLDGTNSATLPIQVNNGGTLRGTGSLSAVDVNAGGTLAPGDANATGTLQVSGLSFAPGSFYDVRITAAGASDETIATGGAAINGGTVRVKAGFGTYLQNTQYTIVSTTDGVTGTFAGVTADFAFLTPILTYDASHVFLSVSAGTAVAVVAGNAVPDYRTAAGTPNQRAVATGLIDGALRNGDTGPLLTAVNQLTVAQARDAFDSLSGEGITATRSVANHSVGAFIASVFDQTTFYDGGSAANSITLTDATAPRPLFYSALAQNPLAESPIQVRAPLDTPRTWRAWATGFGGTDTLHGDAGLGAAAQNSTLVGGSLGVDYQINPNYRVGLAAGGTDGSFAVGGRTTTGSTTGGHVAVYDLATFGSFYGASSASVAFFGNKTTRTLAGFGGLAGETDKASFDSHEFRSRLEAGRHIAAYGATITPFLALEIAELRSNGFTETSLSGPGNFLLNIAGQSSASVPAFVGARYQAHMVLGSGMVFSPSIQAAYVHEFAPQNTQLGSLTALPGATFLVDGARAARNAAQVKAGGELAITPSSSLFATFDGDLSGKEQFYGGKGGFKVVW